LEVLDKLEMRKVADDEKPTDGGNMVSFVISDCFVSGGRRIPVVVLFILGLMAGIATGASAKGEEVAFNTSDGIAIKATWYEASAGAPTVICLHQWRSDASSYSDLAEALLKAGCNVLALDMRGHGRSTSTIDGKPVAPDRLARADVEAAVDWLSHRKGVDVGRLVLIGASYGASNAIMYAADNPSVKAVVLLSPGMNYFNVLPVEPAVRKYGSRPLLLVASSEDMRSVEAVRKITSINKDVYQSKIMDNCGHGTEMFSCGQVLKSLILNFISEKT
jgi:dienelactone hydrolase